MEVVFQEQNERSEHNDLFNPDGTTQTNYSGS